MKKTFLISVVMLSLTFMIVSCNNNNPESVADKFVKAFVKYDFDEAKKYVTPESVSMLEIFKTVATPEVKEAAKDTKVDFLSIEHTSDSTAVVKFNLLNFVDANPFGNNNGEKFTIIPEGRISTVHMLKTDGKWLVNAGKDNNR